MSKILVVGELLHAAVIQAELAQALGPSVVVLKTNNMSEVARLRAAHDFNVVIATPHFVELARALVQRLIQPKDNLNQVILTDYVSADLPKRITRCSTSYGYEDLIALVRKSLATTS